MLLVCFFGDLNSSATEQCYAENHYVHVTFFLCVFKSGLIQNSRSLLREIKVLVIDCSDNSACNAMFNYFAAVFRIGP